MFLAEKAIHGLVPLSLYNLCPYSSKDETGTATMTCNDGVSHPGRVLCVFVASQTMRIESQTA